MFWKGIVVKMEKFKFRAHGFYTEPGWATNEEFRVKIPENFDVQSAKRALREHLAVFRSSGGITV
jgi:hypothetical protein